MSWLKNINKIIFEKFLEYIIPIIGTGMSYFCFTFLPTFFKENINTLMFLLAFTISFGSFFIYKYVKASSKLAALNKKQFKFGMNWDINKIPYCPQCDIFMKKYPSLYPYESGQFLCPKCQYYVYSQLEDGTSVIPGDLNKHL